MQETQLISGIGEARTSHYYTASTQVCSFGINGLGNIIAFRVVQSNIAQ